MTNNEVNKVISEYMGYELHDDYVFKEREYGILQDDLFTNSLDALVPVWERLGVNHFEIISGIDGYYSALNKDLFYSDEMRLTQQEASAHATAKAILALNEKEQND